jgi:hypothetical protein
LANGHVSGREDGATYQFAGAHPAEAPRTAPPRQSTPDCRSVTVIPRQPNRALISFDINRRQAVSDGIKVAGKSTLAHFQRFGNRLAAKNRMGRIGPI